MARKSQIRREAEVERAFLAGEPLWCARVQRITGYGRIRAKRLMRRLIFRYGGCRKMRVGSAKVIIKREEG